MKLIRVFKITNDEFWDYVEDGIVQEVEKATKHRFKKKDLVSGFHYDNNAAKSKVKIDKYERGKIYQSTVKTLTDYVKVSYETKEVNDGLEITFEQVVGSYDDHKDEKNGVIKFFTDWTTFGRMSNTLYDMRNAIINKRDGVEVKNIKEMRQNNVNKLQKFLDKKHNGDN